MPQFTLEPNPKQNPTRAAAQRGSWVIELPAAARTNEGQLRAAAARLLELAPVRSVIVDRDRTQAKVRLKSSQSQCALDGEILIHWPAGNVAAAAHLPIIFWTDPCDESLCFIKLPVRAQGWRRALL